MTLTLFEMNNYYYYTYNMYNVIVYAICTYIVMYIRPTYFEYLFLSYIIKFLNHTLTCTCHISKLSQCAYKNHKKVLDIICILKNRIKSNTVKNGVKKTDSKIEKKIVRHVYSYKIR